MNYELIITATMTIIALGVSLYSARNSASKSAVDSLKTLIDSLEKRLEEEVEAREKLEVKLRAAQKYIRSLVKQLRDNNITPIEIPEELELWDQ